MRTITLKKAKAIAADWHGAQWSALYAFASANGPESAQELLKRCLPMPDRILRRTVLLATGNPSFGILT